MNLQTTLAMFLGKETDFAKFQTFCRSFRHFRILETYENFGNFGNVSGHSGKKIEVPLSIMTVYLFLFP